MVGLSWPLWLDGQDFPRIPLVLDWNGFSVGISWSLRILLVSTLGLAIVGRRGRWWSALVLLLMGLEVVGDQNRLQSWVWQFGVVSFGFVAFPTGVGLPLARLYAISLYLWSGLSKLDASFLNELGPTFLSATLRPIGFAPESWSSVVRATAILGMPGSEVIIAVGLCFPRTRRIALGLAIGLHLTLLWVLGPVNLGHSPNVLVWNASMILEGVCLFGSVRIDSEPRLGWAARGLAILFFVFPMGERFGLADSWPSHALYASHGERTEIDLFENDLDRFPDSIRRFVAPVEEGPWRRLDLTGWSRSHQGTPLYPQSRVGSGIGEWLALRSGRPRSVRVRLWSRAGAWMGGATWSNAWGWRRSGGGATGSGSTLIPRARLDLESEESVASG